MEEQKENLVYREGTPPTELGKTESTTPLEEKTPIEKKLDALESEGVIPSENEAKEQENKVKISDVKPVEKELTPEQEHALAKHEAKKAEKEKKDLAKKQKAYQMLQQGAYFMKFIFDDVERQKKEQLNRSQRRRFTKELRKGIFSRELVDVYAGKVDQALDWIEKNLNNAEQMIKKMNTHYSIHGFENPEILKNLLEDYFKGKFVLKGEEKEKEVDGAEWYKKVKEDEKKSKRT